MKDPKSLRGKSTAKGPHLHEKSAPEKVLIIGRNPVAMFIERSAERAVKAFLLPGEGSDEKGSTIAAMIRKKGIPASVLGRNELAALCGSEGHQGFVLEIKRRELLDLHGLLAAASKIERGIIVALDGIQDPQNLGSIFRAAECLGAKAIVWSRNRNVSMTPAVSKVSAGASEIVPAAEVSNLRDALEKLKKEGFWTVASVIDREAVKLREFRFPEKCCLVLGSEGEGVKPLIAKEADFKVYIEQFGVVDSLNVSQASAVFLAEYARQMM